METCWICGLKADSGEHKIKRSDLKLLIGDPTQQNPMHWFEGRDSRSVKVGSIKSKKLHFENKICSKCNNVRTQNADQAWQRLSEYINKHIDDIRVHGKVSLSDAYAGPNQEFKIDLQLFFVKLLGCYIIDVKVPVSLVPLAQSIIDREACPSVYLMFSLVASEFESVHISELRSFGFSGRVDYLVFQYSVGDLVVFVIYDPRRLERKILRKSFHPKKHTVIIDFQMKD